MGQGKAVTKVEPEAVEQDKTHPANAWSLHMLAASLSRPGENHETRQLLQINERVAFSCFWLSAPRNYFWNRMKWEMVQLEARKYVGNYLGVGVERGTKQERAMCRQDAFTVRSHAINCWMCMWVWAGVERGVYVCVCQQVCGCAFSWGCAHIVCDLRLAGIKIEFTTQGNWRVKKLAKGVRHSQVNWDYIEYIVSIYTYIYIKYIVPRACPKLCWPRSALITLRIRNIRAGP